LELVGRLKNVDREGNNIINTFLPQKRNNKKQFANNQQGFGGYLFTICIVVIAVFLNLMGAKSWLKANLQITVPVINILKGIVLAKYDPFSQKHWNVNFCF
jgi:hypothetical protein